MQWAYLFERFPSFTQTFCYREVAEMQRQGLAPWIFSIRRPRNEPSQDYPAGLASGVRYLPEEDELSDEFRWLRRCDRLPESLRATEQRFKGSRDKARLQEAGWLGAHFRTLGIGHVHTHFAGLAARTAYWLREHFGIGFSFTAHANDIFSPPEAGLSVTLDELMRTARFVVTVSDFSAELLRSRFPFAAGKIARVYNGIETTALTNPVSPVTTEVPLILSVGRYIEKKGFHDLISACALLRERGVSFRCKIVGEGPLESRLCESIRAANLQPHVELTGSKSVATIIDLLQSTRAFCLPCVKEVDGGMDNLPTVIAEAMAAGVPVVSTQLAGIPEMVLHDKTGFLVPSSDPTQLADALGCLLSNPVTASEMGKAGKERARQHFDVRATTRQLKRLLLEQTKIPISRAALRQDPMLWWLDFKRRRRT